MTTGRFITFEGGEGSGKSTQARRLAARLTEAGHDVLSTREPGGSPFAEALRDVILGGRLPAHAPLSEALLFYAARADHLSARIRPALAAGRWVICDRFSDSTRVYQGVAGRLPETTLETLEAIVVAPTTPDLTVIVDVPPEIGLARARRRAAPDAETDPYESRELAFHQQLRAGFLAIARAQPRRCVVVDGTQDEDTVAAAIWSAVAGSLHEKAAG